MDPGQLSPTTTIHSAVSAAASQLAAAGFPTARLDAEVLFRHLSGRDRTSYFLHRMDPISAAELESLSWLITRRLNRESVAYIVGRREFMGLMFAVGPGVLVPRPETEILVEWALEQLTGAKSALRVVDVGTGSGAIALSLGVLAPSSHNHSIIASDVSRYALRYAAANRMELGLHDSVSIVRGDLAEWCGGGIDLLLANLPYLRPDQIAGNLDLAPEPIRALDGGADGLDLVRRLLSDASRLLSPNGAIGLEIDPSQADATIALGRAIMSERQWSVMPDLAGLPRHVVGTSRLAST